MQQPTEQSLLIGLQERYSSIRSLRDRIQSITLWLLWILLWVSGWIIQSKTHFKCNEKLFFIIAIFITLVIFYFYFEDLKKWAVSQINASSRIEDELWFFDWNNPIYPLSRKTQKTDRSFLRFHYIILVFWFVVLVSTILYFA